MKILDFRKYLPLILIILSVCYGLYNDYYLKPNNISDPVVENVEEQIDNRETIKVNISQDVKHIELDDVDPNIKYIDQNDNEILFLGNVMQNDKGHKYVLVKYVKDDDTWRTEYKYLGDKYLQDDSEQQDDKDNNTVTTPTNNQPTNNQSTNKPNANTGKTTTSSQSGNSNVGSSNKTPTTNQSSNSNSNTANNNSNASSNTNTDTSTTANNSGSSNDNQQSNNNESLGNSGSSEPACTWREVQVLVTPGHYEKVLVSNEWNEWIETKPAWDETYDFCTAIGYDYEYGYQCSTCGAFFTSSADAAKHLHEAQHSSYGNAQRPIGEQHCLSYETRVRHHDAEGYVVNHPAEYKDVWVDPVYRTEKVCD